MAALRVFVEERTVRVFEADVPDGSKLGDEHVIKDISDMLKAYDDARRIIGLDKQGDASVKMKLGEEESEWVNLEDLMEGEEDRFEVESRPNETLMI